MLKKIKFNKIVFFVVILLFAIIGLIVFLLSKNTHSVGVVDNTEYYIDYDVDVCNNLGDVEFYDHCLIQGELVSDKSESVTDQYFEYMRYNTRTLQELIDQASELGKNENRIATIKLPEGIFYFISGGYNVSRYTDNSRKVENVVINLKNNVRLIGSGIDENGINTTLKPYSKVQDPSINKSDCYNNYESCVYKGLDMFYFNDYIDYNQKYGDGTYLENVYFEDFIIDGYNVNEVKYDSCGKGFMINLCKNCHWNKMVVKNTAATGFGMDNVIDGSITNSKAINNGRRAKEWVILHPEVDLRDIGGQSGFGIGTGYSNDESMYIENCSAIGNAKYGYFFEHQNRFNITYKATKSQGFVVVNSSAENNMYNYGGERANDVVYINNTSIKGETTISDIMFKSQSRRTYMSNMSLSTKFSDVSDSSYYSDAAYWALSNGILTDDYAELTDNVKFNGSENVSRSNALMMIWRMAGMPGDVLYYSSTPATGSELCGIGGLQLSGSRNLSCIVTDFTDISESDDVANAIKWGVENGIVKGNSQSTFNPDGNITTNALVYFLYRYTNSFTGTTASDNKAFDWANSVNLFSNLSTGVETESHILTRAEIVQILYNYSNSKNVNFPIYYALMGDDVNKASFDGITYYTSGNNFNLDNPLITGYRFVGWIGSNGTNPSNVSISSSSTGNKVYVAKYDKVNYKVYYNGNGADSENYDNSESCNSSNVCGLDRYASGSKYNYDNNTFESSRVWKFNKSYSLIYNRFVKKGYKFLGWSLTPDGSVKYKQSEEVSNLTDIDGTTIILYAVWVSDRKKITFNANGGEVIGSNELFVELDSDVVYNSLSGDDIGQIPMASKNGYKFTGWWTKESDGELVVFPSGIITEDTISGYTNRRTWNLESDVNLYAQYDMNYTVSYNCDMNGGTGSINNDYNAFDNVDLNKTCTKDGWVFVGWNTEVDATNKLDSFIMPSKNVVLYGIYKKEAITLRAKFDGNGAELSDYNIKECSITEVYNKNTQETSCVVDAPMVVRSKYIIMGYNTDSNAKINDSNYNNVTRKLTLNVNDDVSARTWYAQTKKESVTLKAKFDANGVNLVDSSDKSCIIPSVYNQEIPATTCTVDTSLANGFDRSELFYSLSENGNAADNYNRNNGDLTLNINDDINGRTWYVIISRQKYKVTFDANGGSSFVDSAYVIPGLDKIYKTADGYDVLNMPIASKGGYTFLGWFTDDGTKIINASGILVNGNIPEYIDNGVWNVNKDIILYALYNGQDKLEFNQDENFIVANEDNIIYGIVPNYAINLFTGHVITSGKINILDSNNIQLTENIKLRTGYKLRVTFTTNYIDYVISVKGDVLGTGELSRENAKYIARHVIDRNVITGREYLLSADYNNDGIIKMNDVIRLLRESNNKENS